VPGITPRNNAGIADIAGISGSAGIAVNEWKSRQQVLCPVSSSTNKTS
jgi:hypothetical protein